LSSSSSSDRPPAGEEPALLVARALVNPEARALLDRAYDAATTPRDRQLVAIAAAHLAGDVDRVDALARDHLHDHPDSPVSPVVAWMAAHPRPSTDRTSHRPPQHQEPS
jgi:hypothetical protein